MTGSDCTFALEWTNDRLIDNARRRGVELGLRRGRGLLFGQDHELRRPVRLLDRHKEVILLGLKDRKSIREGKRARFLC